MGGDGLVFKFHRDASARRICLASVGILTTVQPLEQLTDAPDQEVLDDWRHFILNRGIGPTNWRIGIHAERRYDGQLNLSSAYSASRG